MRVYLDCCCLNRPFDDPSQESVRIEIAAVEIIMERVATGEWVLLGSDALAAEVARIRDDERRQAVMAMLARSGEWISTSAAVIELGEELEVAGFTDMDAAHLASATLAVADVFLTVDKRLYNRAKRQQHPRVVRTDLPAKWLEGLAKEKLQ